ncbi:uncharacterized protein [Procambarus clarkii]|uniref:uncharacterized protein n=1 Tax=Procambarus clarkii TaxID=6728 RepID=UPI003744A8A1
MQTSHGWQISLITGLPASLPSRHRATYTCVTLWLAWRSSFSRITCVLTYAGSCKMLVTMWCWAARLLLVLLPMAPPLLRLDDHLILRYYAAVMRVVRPVLVHVLHLLTKKKNLKQLLFELPLYSKTKYRNHFDREQRQQLDDNVSSENYDITLLFTLLQKVGGLAEENNAKWSTQGTLENKLRKLKNHRNILAHEELSLTPEKLQNILSNIEELCREVLVLAGLRCRSLVSEKVKVMEEGLSEVLTGGVDLWEPYKEALHNLQQEQCNILVREGKKEIKELAKNLRILNPFVWLMEDNFAHLDVNQIFTDLDIEGQGQVDTKDFFTNPLPTGKYPDVLITHGSPGIGKTSLTRYFIHDWLSVSPSINGIDEFDIVLPVELRHVTSKDTRALLCDEVLRNACHHLKSSDIIPTLREVSTLWLLDGYDEATKKTKRLVKEILKKFHNSKFMITTRTDCVHELQMLVSELHRSQGVYQLRGLTPDKWTSYATKLFSVSFQDDINGRRDSCRRFLQFMKEKEEDMWEIFSVPLFVVVLVVLWLEKPSDVTEATTVTRLYHILINHIINRMTRRLQLSPLSLSESQLRDKINSFLNLLGNIFWENSQRYKYVLFDYQIKEIEKLCEKSGLPFKECMSPFFLVIVKPSITGTQEEYYPLHRTVQEFLAARAFCDAMITQASDVLTIAAHWMVEHRENFTKYFPNEKEVHGKDNNKRDFVMNKLCEGSNNMFDNYDFVGECIFSLNCFCSIYEPSLSAHFGDPGERERYFCYQYFTFCVSGITGSLIIPFICGILKLNNELTQKRAEQIIYVVICGEDKIRNYVLWLRLLDETYRDSVFLKELTSQISPYQWNPTPNELPEVGQLLQFVTPESLLVHLCELSECTDNNFIEGLRILSRFPIRISLDLGNGMNKVTKSSLTFTEKCLSLLLASGTSCRLIALGVPLNKQSLSMLCHARHLEDLCVRVDTLEDLQTLAQITNNLQNLTNLCVFMNFVFSNISYKVLPTFNIKQHTGANLSFAQVPKKPFKGIVSFFGKLYLKPHKCTPPKVTSHKQIHRFVNVRKGGKMSYLCKPTLPALPYPIQLEGLKTSGIYEFCRTMWNLPSVHCHSRCDERFDPVLCWDKCRHILLHIIFRVSQPTKHQWFHCHRAIRYHQSCFKRLRSFYNILWMIIVENFKPGKLTYTKSYDPIIKVFCYNIQDQQLLNNVWIKLNILSLKVCELLMYEHKICIQQHRKLLTHVREPSIPVSPVQLAFIDPFTIDATTFRSMVQKLCPTPFMIYALNMSRNSSDTDVAHRVLHLCQSFPSIKSVAIRNYMPMGGSDLKIVEIIEKSAPYFIYSFFDS